MQKLQTFISLTALIWATGCGVSPRDEPQRYSDETFQRTDEISDLSQNGIDTWGTSGNGDVVADEEPPPVDEVPFFGEEDIYGLSTGRLAGGLGPVAFDSNAVQLGSWTDVGYTEVTGVVNDGVGGAAMTILVFYGGLDNAALVPGAQLSFENSYSTDADVDLELDVIGCSGPQSGQWDYFDVPATDTQVEVEEGDEPGVVVLKYRASFTDYNGATGNVTGSFNYRLP